MDPTGQAPPTAAVVLAAGRATRFGATKQLAEVDGRPLVRHAVDAAVAAGLAPVVVVVGHDAAEVRAALPAGVTAVDNPAHADGQSTSLRAGVAAVASSDAPALVVLLADQPGIDPDVVARVAAVQRDGGHPVVRARYRDRPGHPVCFGRATWPALARVTGDAGARQLLDDLPVVDVEVDADCPPDVDVPSDLPDV